jgi:Peptidase C39 family
MKMPIDFRTESLREPVASRDTAISCLVRLGAQNGVNLQIEAVRRLRGLDGDTITVSRLIKLADECGLQLEWIRLDWQGLKTTSFGQLLIFRENTNCVVLTEGARTGAEEVSIWDPHHDGVIFFMGREEFERAWNGHALMITPKEPGKGCTSPSQQSGFKAVASEIRGTPTEIVKPESPGNPTLGAGSSSPGPHGRPTRPWRRPLLSFASIGAVASVSITIFLFIHPVGDKALSIGTSAREDAAVTPKDAPSAGEMAARRSAAGAAASASPEMTSTPATSEPAALATGNAPSPAPAGGVPYAAANPADTAPASTAISVGPAPSATTAAASSSANELNATPPAAPTTGLTETGLSDADAAALLARGDVLFSKGDIVAARLFYERAAYAGEGQAALRLGETFDPVFLDQARLRGARGDLSTALSWYRRARDLGVAEAEILLKTLEPK